MKRLPNPWTTTPLTMAAAAAAIGVSRSAAYRAAAAGDLETVPWAGRRRVRAAELYRVMGLPLPDPPGTPRIVTG